MKTTPWYPGTVKPVRIGVYQRQYGFGDKYCLWTGKYWCMWEPTVKMASKSQTASGFKLQWRGLTEEASGAAIGGAKP